jgi:hypothetical protein
MRDGVKLALIAAAVIALLAAIGTAIFISVGDRDAAQNAAIKTADVTVEKRGEAAAGAAKVVEKHYEYRRDIERIRDAGLAAVAAAPDDAAGGAAVRQSLCLLDPASYHEHPACQLQ